MTTNEKIVESAYEIIRGDGRRPPQSSGMCLGLVRIVVENALFDGAWRFYEWKTHEATGKPPGRDPWARDMERSLTLARMAVPSHRTGPDGDPGRYVDLTLSPPTPGDLLFRWDTAKDLDSGEFIGHVGLAMPGRMVLENVSPSYREAHTGVWRGPTRLSPLGAWPVTTVVRFDP